LAAHFGIEARFMADWLDGSTFNARALTPDRTARRTSPRVNMSGEDQGRAQVRSKGGTMVTRRTTMKTRTAKAKRALAAELRPMTAEEAEAKVTEFERKVHTTARRASKVARHSMQETMTAAKVVRESMKEAFKAVARAARNIAKENAAAWRETLPAMKPRPVRKPA
jgi:hypothetical protein